MCHVLENYKVTNVHVMLFYFWGSTLHIPSTYTLEYIVLMFGHVDSISVEPF